MAFNPNEHVMQLQNKDYLEVKWRLVWFRDLCPNGTIETEMLHLDLDREVTAEVMVWNNETRKKEKVIKQAKGYCVFHAIIKDGKGGVGTGTKSEAAVDFADFIEKAESGAIGRALATLGYGTQFTGDELEEGKRIVDSPVDRSTQQANTQEARANRSAQQSNAQRSQQARTPQAPAKPAERNNNAQTTPEQPAPKPIASIPTFNGLRNASIKHLDEETFDAVLKDFMRDNKLKPDHEFGPDDIVKLRDILYPMIHEAREAAKKAS